MRVSFYFLLAILHFPVFTFALTEMRISTENTPTHIQTQIVSDFVKSVNEHLGDKIHAIHYHSGQLFKDKDIVGALDSGQVDMAVPGNWQLDKYEPKVGIFLLPSFYGLTYEKINQIRDGLVGKEINRALEKSTGVRVLGRWIDLGYAHIYSLDTPINSYPSIKNKRIRVAGGVANISRIRALGGNPVSIPWGELKSAIAKDKVDGILTTHETIASAELWKNGIRFCFEDSDYFPQYIPLLSEKFLERIDESTKNRLALLWEAQVDNARQRAKDAQESAKQELIRNGILITTPDESEKDAARLELKKVEGKLLQELDIDPAFLNKALEAR